MQHASRFPEVFQTTPELRSRLSRDLKAGRIRRLAPGIYTSNVTEPLDTVARRLVWDIASLVFPGAVMTDRTAFEAQPATDGSVFLAAGVDRDVHLPGVRLRAHKGPGRLPGDTDFYGLFLASRPRAYLENMRPSRARSGVARTLSRAQVEERLEKELVSGGEAYVNTLRDEARRLAPQLGLEAEQKALDALIGALLGTRDAKLVTDPAKARASGQPYDPHRLELFAKLQADLLKLAPTFRPDPDRPDEARLLPFFEAYFSNFIEGTEFEVDEARAIVFENRIPTDRPADAHDVLGTFRVVSDRAELSRTPRDAEELTALLRSRHARVMEGRPETRPGTFKTKANRAGSTVFVAPDSVAGTLARGFELYRGLTDAFQRAVFMMFLVSEVHPFADGNGRVARIMMTAELVKAGERRIIVPTIYRSSYLSGLRAMSHSGRTETLQRSLDFLQRYCLAIDFSTYDGARRQLEETNAFRDPQEADAEGIRLKLPA